MMDEDVVSNGVFNRVSMENKHVSLANQGFV